MWHALCKKPSTGRVVTCSRERMSITPVEGKCIVPGAWGPFPCNGDIVRKTNLKLVVASPRTASSRPFETDYAGSWRGHCKTRESAAMAATRHMVCGGYSRCTITNKATDSPVARLRLSEDRKRVIIELVEPLKRPW